MATASKIGVVCKNSVNSRIAGRCNQGGCNFKCSWKTKVTELGIFVLTWNMRHHT